MRIRHATADDLPALAALAERSFRNAFASYNSPADVDAYVHKAFSVESVRHEFADVDNTFLLAWSNSGDIAGYAKLRKGQADDSVAGPDPIEIERFYANPDMIGRGIGSALMRACLDESAARGYRTIRL
jgi:ribosomal protein S18 acetylase RimI-like enzyme